MLQLRSMMHRMHGAARARGDVRMLRALCTVMQRNNYFKVLGVPQQFDVDLEDMASRFKSLQRKWHPDRHASGESGSNPEKAAETSALLNEAYNALRSPDTRARHLLTLMDGDDEPEIEPTFLSWVLEYREKISNVEPGSDQLVQLNEEVSQAYNDCLELLESSFTDGRVEDASKQTAKLKYLTRMRTALEDTKD